MRRSWDSGGSPLSVVGVDVGGHRKGFHAIAMNAAGILGRRATCDPIELADWISTEIKAGFVAVDAPCRWSADSRTRPAERQLIANGIWCFSTPDQQRALEHPKDHYGWMLRGEALFESLRSTHPLCNRLPLPGLKCVFETFPHAICVASHRRPRQRTAETTRAPCSSRRRRDRFHRTDQH